MHFLSCTAIVWPNDVNQGVCQAVPLQYGLWHAARIAYKSTLLLTQNLATRLLRSNETGMPRHTLGQ